MPGFSLACSSLRNGKKIFSWYRAGMPGRLLEEPMRFGRRLWIVPSWHQAPEPQAVNLLLDPGLAFGTGTHPTTALCLEWLDGQDLAGCTVLDFGCGSGIRHRRPAARRPAGGRQGSAGEQRQ